jgi:hypothetical protein
MGETDERQTGETDGIDRKERLMRYVEELGRR